MSRYTKSLWDAISLAVHWWVTPRTGTKKRVMATPGTCDGLTRHQNMDG